MYLGRGGEKGGESVWKSGFVGTGYEWGFVGFVVCWGNREAY